MATSPIGPAPDVASMTILIRLPGLLPSLSRAERSIAAIILDDPLMASRLNISQMATRAQVSETSVTRFSRQQGLKGYPDLRRTLFAAAEQQRSDQERGETRLQIGSHIQISPNDTASQTVRKIAEAERRALAETVEQLDAAVLDTIANLLTGVRRVDLYAVGSSALVAADLEYKLHHLGIAAFAWSDVHRAVMSASHLDHRDVAFGISYSGRTRETLDSLAEARLHGAATVALTNDPRSPITKHSDFVLTSAGHENPFRSGATVSRMAQLLTVDCLYVRTAHRRGFDSESALEQAHGATQRHRAPSDTSSEPIEGLQPAQTPAFGRTESIGSKEDGATE